MSADNGVYILATKGRKGKKEYRVADAQAIENLWYSPDYPATSAKGELNREEVLRYFGDCRVFTDKKIAEGYAECLFDRDQELIGYVEYGIRFLNYTHLRFPSETVVRIPAIP